MKTIRTLALAVTVLIGTGTSASASLINTPVPSNAFITVNGFDWAWAMPVAPDGSFSGTTIDLSVQAAFGWRLPTPAELVLAPRAVDFLFDGGNVPFAVGGGTDPLSGAFFNFTVPGSYDALGLDGANAVPWFNNRFREANWRDGRGEPFGRDWWTPGSPSFYETLVIREAQAVPEPASIAIWSALGGIGLLTARGRRKRMAKA